MLGEDVDFTFEWISLYRFQSRRLQRFRHGRVLFAGDAAHQMSPFGARGGNSGVQDADNLVWKLDLVLRGLAPERLLDSYDAERIAAADENLLNTTRSTDFIAPKSAASRTFRDSVLALAETEPFARRLVNSGRLIGRHLLRRLAPQRPRRLCRRASARRRARAPPRSMRRWATAGCSHALGRGLHRRLVLPRRQRAGRGRAHPGCPRPARAARRAVVVSDATACARYGAAREPAFYLFRPDGHVAARWRQPSLTAVEAALARASGRDYRRLGQATALTQHKTRDAEPVLGHPAACAGVDPTYARPRHEARPWP